VLATSVKVVFKFSTDGSHTSSGQLLREYDNQHAWFHHLATYYPSGLPGIFDFRPLKKKKKTLASEHTAA